MALVLPDSSVLIPYLARRAHDKNVEQAIRSRRLILCSVVAEEIMAGALDQVERQRYDAFFNQFGRSKLVATPNDDEWRRCGRILSRYRERFGAIRPRDHHNDVLISLTAIRLAQEQEIILITENDADFNTWLGFIHNRYHLRVEAVRR